MQVSMKSSSHSTPHRFSRALLCWTGAGQSADRADALQLRRRRRRVHLQAWRMRLRQLRNVDGPSGLYSQVPQLLQSSCTTCRFADFSHDRSSQIRIV